MLDCAYFLTRYYWIKTPQAIQRFTFLPGQRVYFDVIAELESRYAPIELIIDKARQHGISTATEGIVLHRAATHYGVNAVVASAQRQSTGKMAQMTFLGYDRLPWWMRPLSTRRVESDQGMLVFGGSESGISFQHGNQRYGIARGDTVKIYHLCVAGKTLIRADNGRLVPMRELAAGRKAISLSGKLANIKKFWKSPRQNETTCEILTWGTPTPLSTTRDHRILTEAGWKEAKDITNLDWLIYPKRPISQGGKVCIKEYGRHSKGKFETADIEPSFEFGRLCGLYLAEGCLIYSAKKTACTVAFAIHEKENERVRAWVASVFGEARQTQRRANSKTAIVSLGHRGFAEWIIENLGTKDEKHVPDICWNLGRDFCRGLVFGYLSGDGHFAERDNTIYATSIRVAILTGIRELVASLGYGWSQITYREAGEWYNRNCQQCWILTICGETAENVRRDFGIPVKPQGRKQPPLHWHWSSQGVAVSVEGVGDGFSEDFYDLEIEDADHAFLTASGIVHNSEVASYSNADDLIEASLFKCVHPHPDVFGALESTAEGDTGWWYDTYWHAKRSWKNNRSRLCPLFLPWFVGTDKYPTETWARTHPVPSNWRPKDYTRKMMARAEIYVQSAPILSKVLGDGWTMPRMQSYYWEVHFEEAQAKGKEKLFLQEMPTDDVESFQGSYDNVFGREVIADVWTKRKTSYAVYGIVGQSIEERHEPDEADIDHTERIIPVSYFSRKAEKTYRWELWPLKWVEPFGELTDILNDESHMGKLLVWHEPEPGYDYAIGVDTSGGLGSDATCVAVARRGRTSQEQDVQVAEFRSNQVSHVEAYAWTMAIAAYYARYMEDTTRYREPYVAVEQVAAVGDTCQLQMSKMGYSRFHQMIRYDSTPKAMRKSKSHKRGWFTHGWSRPMLTDGFVILVKNGWYKVNSPYTMREMSQWEVHFTAGDKEKFEHSEDFTDDGIFANAMAGFCPNDLKTQAERSVKQFNTEDTRLPKIDIEPTGALMMNPDGHGTQEYEVRGMMRR